jgi:hypothetical protein
LARALPCFLVGWRRHVRIGEGQIDNVKKPNNRMLIFRQLYSLLQCQVRRIASVDRYQDAIVHFNALETFIIFCPQQRKIASVAAAAFWKS